MLESQHERVQFVNALPDRWTQPDTQGGITP